MDLKRLLQKIEWEGGAAEAVVGYGLGTSDLDSADDEVMRRWNEVVSIGQGFDQAVQRFYDHPEVQAAEEEIAGED